MPLPLLAAAPALLAGGAALAGTAARFAPAITRGAMAAGSLVSRLGPAATGLAPVAVAAKDYKPSSISKLREEDTYQAPKSQYDSPAGPAYNGPAIPDIGQGQGAAQSQAARQSQSLSSMIGKGWDDVSTKGASSALKSLSKDMGMLSNARDAYLQASLERKAAKENAIAGNKELIDRYQTKDLRNLGGQLRSKVLNTNIALGAAGSGSAGLAASRALARENAVNRSNVLTEYGDEMSAQNRQQQLIEPEYQAERQKAYDWEERNKRSLIENFNIQKKALDRLKSKVPDWKKEDLENENANNLNSLLQGLASIEATARSFRDNLYSTYYGMQDEASALRTENLNIQAPSELDTPDFSPELDMTGLENEEYDTTDYYRPSTKLKKKTGRSIFDNPLIFEEEAA